MDKMPTITLNKKVFEELVGKKLPLEKLKDRISMLGTDLESIEGNDINVEVFPNRPDMLSEQGFARAFSSFIGVNTGLKTYEVQKGVNEVLYENPTPNWPISVCAMVRNLELTEEKVKEIINIQEKLTTTLLRRRKKGGIGVYPAEKLTFPIRYSALPKNQIEFIPLGWTEKASAEKILSEHQTGKEYGSIVKGWKDLPVFLDATQKILSMPPLTNANEVGRVTATTTEVFIEVSGKDLKTCNVALNILVCALADMGGNIETLKVNGENYPDLSPNQMKVPLEYINQRLGLQLSALQCTKYLERMGMSYENEIVLYPAYRADILHPVDIAEEVAIAYGYENFTPTLPNVATTASELDSEMIKRRVAEMFIGIGFNEAETYHLTNEQNQNTKMLSSYQLVGLKSCVNTEFNVLRRWLLPSLMEVLGANLNREYPQKIFTFGRIFKPANTTTHVEEAVHLSAVWCAETADFTQIKQVVEYLSRLLNIEIKIKEKDYPFYIPGRSAEVSIATRVIGHMGEVHPQGIINWGLEHPVVACELSLDELTSKIQLLNK